MKKIIQFLQYEKVRYLIIGGLTTLVNFVSFYILYNIIKLDVTVSNFISVCVAIIFAFWTNKYVVFRSGSLGFRSVLGELLKFVGGRIVAMAIEVGGVYLLFNILGIPAMISKIFVQVIVVVFNYVISKFFVFRTEGL